MKLTAAQTTLLRSIEAGEVTAGTVMGGAFDHWKQGERKVTAAVNKLVDAGLVEKPVRMNRNYRNVRSATLTEAGRAALNG